MNALAVVIHRFTESGEQARAAEQPLLAPDERVALAAVLPLLRQSPRSLARLLAAGDPPDVWMTASPAPRPGA